MNSAQCIETAAMLRRHAQLYPLMEPQDAVKLLYQGAFGGGHMIADRERARARLLAEYAATRQCSREPLCVDIGGGWARVNLCALDSAGWSPEALHRWFCASAARAASPAEAGERHAAFISKLDVLRALTRESAVFAFDAAALDAYLRAYQADGCPAVSHSERYRAAYAPAYRVVLSKLENSYM